MPAALPLSAPPFLPFVCVTGPARVTALAVVLLLGAGTAGAAPVTGAQEEAAGPGAAIAPAGAPHNPAGAGARSEVSTGNRNLDLLLEMQGRASEAARAASRPASGLVKMPVPVPTPNTNLSGGVMNEIRAAQGAKPVQRSELLGDLGGSGLSAKTETRDPTQRREWVGHAQGGGPLAGGTGGADASAQGTYAGESPALRAMLESIEWMRANRWQVLGVLLGIVAAAGLIKAYTRRPKG